MKRVAVLHVAKIFAPKQQENEKTAQLNVQENMIIKEKTRLNASIFLGLDSFVAF